MKPPFTSLRDRMRDVPQVGRVAWIGVRPGHEVPMRELDVVEAIAGKGLDGDRAVKGATGLSKRQVTLIQAEHLDVIAKLMKLGAVDPALVRRNLVIEGINLTSVERMKFAIGDEVILEGSGPCEPCAKMDKALGAGAFQAMRGHGGITSRVIRGGVIRIGDKVWVGDL